MDEAQQRHAHVASDAIPPARMGDAGELDRLMEEGERLRARSRELINHAQELTEHSKHLRDQMREVWMAGQHQEAPASDDPTIERDPEAGGR